MDFNTVVQMLKIIAGFSIIPSLIIVLVSIGKIVFLFVSEKDTSKVIELNLKFVIPWAILGFLFSILFIL